MRYAHSNEINLNAVAKATNSYGIRDLYIETELKEIEKRCNAFAEKGRSNTNWTLNQIIRFLHFQKERDEKEEITAATLKTLVE